MPKITELFCFAIDDKDKNNEGVPAFESGYMTLPMMGADLARVEDLMPMAQKLADAHGKPIRIYKFSVKEQIGEILPRELPLSTPSPTVHGLQAGYALCGFASSVPPNWPEGHVWVDPRSDKAQITCEKCLATLMKRSARDN